MPGRISLAVDVDYPPYAYVATPPEGDFTVAGFGTDVALGLMEVCPNLQISVRQTQWSQCWDGSTGLNSYGQGPRAGDGLDSGWFHGCMTYTHTTGVRNRYLEFTEGILQANKPAGIITLLDNGVPRVLPNSTLAGKKVVDVAGWAPTSDALALVTNKCTGGRYGGYEIVTPTEDGNDAAMAILRAGEADAMWIYADQAYNFQEGPGIIPTWNTTLWRGFGTEYAYIATGQSGHAYNGTTLAISKKGSGLASVLNPCIRAFMKTQSYHEVCAKHGQINACYPNEYFNTSELVAAAQAPYLKPTNEQTGDCSNGYCPCNV